MAFTNLQSIKQRIMKTCMRSYRVVAIGGLVREAVAEHVGCYQMEIALQLWPQGMPVVGTHRVATQQQQCRALAATAYKVIPTP